MGSGTMEVFCIGDRLYKDGRFQTRFESFSWQDLSCSRPRAIVSRQHTLSTLVFEFMKHSKPQKSDTFNARAAHNFWASNSYLVRNIMRGRGFRMTLDAVDGDPQIVYEVLL